MQLHDRVTVSGTRYPDPVKVGPFRVERRIAEGRSTLVYACTSPEGDPVCAKLLLPPFDDSPVESERFLESAKAAARLQHPNIVEVLAWGREGKRPFVVTELVRGEDLARLVARGGPLKPRAALEHVRQAAQGLGAGRGAGLLHGDVRPAHLLLEGSCLKVSSFGLSPRWQTAHGRTVVGEAAYLAPEQVLGKPSDQRADIYALGCTLFELVTARTPFGVGAADALLACHVHEPFPRPSQVAPRVPVEVDELVRLLTAKDPQARPRGYEDVCAHLDRALAALVADGPSGPLLVVESGREPGRSIELLEGDLVIGRSAEEGFFVDDGRVSRRHALVRRSGAALEVRDLGSKNGIRLNGLRVESAPLVPGDRLALGDSVLVVVADEASERVPEAAARAPGASPVRGAWGEAEASHAPAQQASIHDVDGDTFEDTALPLRALASAGISLARAASLEAAAAGAARALADVLGADDGVWISVDEDGRPRLEASNTAEADTLSCVLPAVERALPGQLALSTSVRVGQAGALGVVLAPVRVHDEVRGYLVLSSREHRFSEDALAALEVACSLLAERAGARSHL